MNEQVNLGILGWRNVRPAPREPGHFLWWDSFGWHDCTREEDQRVRDALAAGTPKGEKS